MKNTFIQRLALAASTLLIGGSAFAQVKIAYIDPLSGGKSGGDLGEFGPGQMVAEFNDVCFNEEVGVVHGPVKTQFGYHLIEVTKRSE